MSFDFQIFMMDQFVLMFLVVVVGMILGQFLKIGNSGTLFLGLGGGWWITSYAKKIIENSETKVEHLKAAKELLGKSVVDEIFFTIFLILFVASVGLLAGEKIETVLKKYGAKFIVLGVLITFISAATAYGVTLITKAKNPYQITGVYTGALTSSPGLAAAIETSKGHAKHWAETYEFQNVHNKERILNILGNKNIDIENTKQLTNEEKVQFVSLAEAGIGVGYAVGYPWGVIIVILVMKLFPKIFKINVEEEMKKFREEMEIDKVKEVAQDVKDTYFDVTSFVFVCVAGYLVGTIKIYLGETLGWFSLGATGGVLLIGLYLSHLGKIWILNFRMDKKMLGGIRDLGLAMFLGVVGLRYGYEAINSITGAGIGLSIIGIIVGIVGMLIGFLVGKYLMGINWIMLSGAICGGMTSTPGLGAAIDAVGSDDPASGYGATYPFALFGMVLFSIILNNLPM